MNNYDTVGLYPHNVKAYEEVKKGFEKDKVVGIVRGTGTGKSYIALQYIYDNKDKKVLYLVPSLSIKEHLEEIIKDNPNLDQNRDFNNLEIRTYADFVDRSQEEIEALEIDTLILDEFHHIGADVWGARVNSILETHPNINVLGMTAYTTRDRAIGEPRDMADPEGEELFSNKIVSSYDICDAMIDGVLPKPVYKSYYLYLEKTVEQLEETVNKQRLNAEEKKKLTMIINDAKKILHEAPSMQEIFKTNVKPNGKYIYFCPPNSIKGQNDIQTIQEEARQWVREMGLSEDDYEFYITTAEMREEGKLNRNAFYNNLSLQGESTNNKLRIMFAINQYNEGVHIPGIDGVIMGRATNSDIVYFEQLGRALKVRGDNRKEYDRLSRLSVEELKELCSKREINTKGISKTKMIELLTSPLIIDLANNLDFILELENNLKDKLKQVEENEKIKKENQSRNNDKIREICIEDYKFNLNPIERNLLEDLKMVKDYLFYRWDNNYELAKAYYEHHGDLEISFNFKTINGYENDDNGIALGVWLASQRRNYKKEKLSQDKIDKLKEIGMRFETIFRPLGWDKNYELAKVYYKHHGNLEIPQSFKTINGYKYDDSGIALGTWLNVQRTNYKKEKLSQDRIEKLKEISMRFDDKNDLEWNKNYELAKIYYKYHDNIEIPQKFKTINGYEHDDNGTALGAWINNQRNRYKKEKLSQERIDKLKEIGMRFDNKRKDNELSKMLDDSHENNNKNDINNQKK